jgi:serine protease Do
MSALKSPRHRSMMLAGASVLALGLAWAGTESFAPAMAEVPAAGAVAAPVGQPMSFADVVAKDKPAVVTVTTELAATPADQGTGDGGNGMPPDEFFRRFFGQNGPMPGLPGQGGPEQQTPQQGGMALGSGFMISTDGHVVTNNHVVENATKITVTLDDGTELPATLIGRDAKNDIAVLKVEAKAPLAVLEWGDSDAMRLGDAVLAIGDPFGIGTTVTSGIVSARGRDLHNGPYDDFLQIDAAINHGNSGGPLVDLTGHVIGINTAIYSPNGGNVGVGFAIPSAQARDVVARIIEGKSSIEHGFIGVAIQPVDSGIAEAMGLADGKGAIVSSVQDASPAAGAGVKAGDVIIAVNGTAVDTPRAVSRAIADLAPGDEAKLTLWRDGTKQDLSFKVGTLGGEQVAAAETGGDTAPSGDVIVKDLGVTVADLNADQAHGLKPGETGAMVTAVEGGAAEKGIEAGDVILSVNQKAVGSAADVEKLVTEVKADRKAVLLLIERNGQQSFIAVPLKDA